MREKGKNLALDIIFYLVGGMLVALGAYNFAAASNFPLVGFNGIGLILYKLFGLPIGTVAIALNIPVAIMCYKILGRKFFVNSLIAMVISSVLIDIVAPLLPVYHGNLMLSAICTGVLSGVGYALIYMRGSSTGGTDFVLMTLKYYYPHMSIGKISFIMEAFVIVAGAIFVSRDVDGLIYGMIISFILSVVIDKVMYGMAAGKMALIVTDKPKEVAEKIDQVSMRGCTFIKAEGSYSLEDKRVVMCASSEKQMYGIKEAIKEVDPCSFMIIVESSEVCGEGFRERMM